MHAKEDESATERADSVTGLSNRARLVRSAARCGYCFSATPLYIIHPLYSPSNWWSTQSIKKESLPMKVPESSIQTLLKDLEQKQDELVGVTTLCGRAVSRSTHNIHLAINDGIVAVPIENVERVIPLGNSQPNAIGLVVRNPQEIRPLLKVRPAGPFHGIGSAAGTTVEAARDGDTVLTDRTFKFLQGVGTCVGTDTDTISGGAPDQCDDVETSCNADDLNE